MDPIQTTHLLHATPVTRANHRIQPVRVTQTTQQVQPAQAIQTTDLESLEEARQEPVVAPTVALPEGRGIPPGSYPVAVTPPVHPREDRAAPEPPLVVVPALFPDAPQEVVDHLGKLAMVSMISARMEEKAEAGSLPAGPARPDWK